MQFVKLSKLIPPGGIFQTLYAAPDIILLSHYVTFQSLTQSICIEDYFREKAMNVFLNYQYSMNNNVNEYP